MNPIAIATPRLVLRTIDPSYAAARLDFERRNRAFFAPWDPLPTPEFLTLDEQHGMLQRDFELQALGTGYRFWIFPADEQESARLLGFVSLSNIVRGAFQSCFMGYKIDQQTTNNGYMTEAVRAVVPFAFDSLRLHRVEANIMPRNAASRRVAAKAGFAEEGLAHKYLKINGVWEDHIHYVRLNDVEL